MQKLLAWRVDQLREIKFHSLNYSLENTDFLATYNSFSSQITSTHQTFAYWVMTRLFWLLLLWFNHALTTATLYFSTLSCFNINRLQRVQNLCRGFLQSTSTHSITSVSLRTLLPGFVFSKVIIKNNSNRWGYTPYYSNIIFQKVSYNSIWYSVQDF